MFKTITVTISEDGNHSNFNELMAAISDGYTAIKRDLRIELCPATYNTLKIFTYKFHKPE